MQRECAMLSLTSQTIQLATAVLDSWLSYDLRVVVTCG